MPPTDTTPPLSKVFLFNMGEGLHVHCTYAYTLSDGETLTLCLTHRMNTKKHTQNSNALLYDVVRNLQRAHV